MTTTTRTTRKGYTARALAAVMAVFGVLMAMLMVSAPVASARDEYRPQVCSALDSGKIDVGEHVTSVTITAPDGMLIDQYCVKAGSFNNEHGPVYVTVAPPVKSMSISYPDGKDISHYSFGWSPAPRTYDYAGTGHADTTVCTYVREDWLMKDFGPIYVTLPKVTQDHEWTTAEMAYQDGLATTEATRQLNAEVATYDTDPTGGKCDEPEEYFYAGTAHAEDTVCTLYRDEWAMKDFGPYYITLPKVSQDHPWTDAEKAVEDAKAQGIADSALAESIGEFTTDETGLQCQAPVPASVTACVAAEGTTAFGTQVFGTTDDRTPQSTWTNADGQPLSMFTIGTAADCTTGTVYRQSATVSGSMDICLADGVTGVVVDYNGSASAISTVSDADALFIANRDARAAADADLARQMPTDATPGACTPVTVAPVEPATVAPVEPATVAVPEAATVPVPTTAPLPATVPAGDGSTAPQLPILGWVLVVLATTALAVSAVRLAAGSTR